MLVPTTINAISPKQHSVSPYSVACPNMKCCCVNNMLPEYPIVIFSPSWVDLGVDWVIVHQYQSPHQVYMDICYDCKAFSNDWAVRATHQWPSGDPLLYLLYLPIVCYFFVSCFIIFEQTTNAINPTMTKKLQSALVLLHPFNGLFSSLHLNEARDDGVLRSSGNSWTICKQSTPRSRQINTPTPHHFLQTGCSS